MTTKDLGQYFTVSEELQKFVFDKVKYKPHCLLEPSFGAGHLLKKFKEYDENYPMICYELDEKIEPIINFNKFQTLVYEDFTKHSIQQKFKTIIGNPPYVKQKNGNLYIKFIELCYNLLEKNGEMIFIVPSDFMKLTSAGYIINKMISNGGFTDLFFPHNEKLFDGANIDVVVFRYEKDLDSQKTIVNGKEMFCNVNNSIITFSESLHTGPSINSKFNIYVGIVSGKEKVYKTQIGNTNVLNDENKVEKYIFIESFPSGNEQIDEYLLNHKNTLLQRKIRKFSDDNWFEWGAPRNISNIIKNWGKTCIYVKTLTRNTNVAFIGKVQYFGGSLLCLIPNPNTTDSDILTTLQYINSDVFKKEYTYSGRFKIGHKQLCSVRILHSDQNILEQEF
jgi:adenine-specific DNA-methyltransferase